MTYVASSWQLLETANRFRITAVEIYSRLYFVFIIVLYISEICGI